jgi:hypothetical protein
VPSRYLVRCEAIAQPGLIVPLAGYHVPDPAPGAFNVASPPRYQVDVAMKDGLQCSESGPTESRIARQITDIRSSRPTTAVSSRIRKRGHPDSSSGLS